MTGRESAVKDEPLEDAYLDVSNYGIMATIVKNGKWGKQWKMYLNMSVMLVLMSQNRSQDYYGKYLNIGVGIYGNMVNGLINEKNKLQSI